MIHAENRLAPRLVSDLPLSCNHFLYCHSILLPRMFSGICFYHYLKIPASFSFCTRASYSAFVGVSPTAAAGAWTWVNAGPRRRFVVLCEKFTDLFHGSWRNLRFFFTRKRRNGFPHGLFHIIHALPPLLSDFEYKKNVPRMKDAPLFCLLLFCFKKLPASFSHSLSKSFL